MDLSTVFQKYAQNENGQLILKFSEIDHLCKISIEDGEAVHVRLGRLDIDEIISFITTNEIVEVSFIKGFIPKKKFPVPITKRILGNNAYKASDDSLTMRKSLPDGEQITPAKINTVINAYIDIVGPLGAVMLENLLKKFDYIKGTPMTAADYACIVGELVDDVPDNMRAEFMEFIK